MRELISAADEILVIAPTLIASFQLVEQLSPPERLTEGLTLATTAIVLGVAVAAAVSGRLIDQLGTPHAYVVTTASGVLTAAVAALGVPRLPPDAEPAPGDTSA